MLCTCRTMIWKVRMRMTLSTSASMCPALCFAGPTGPPSPSLTTAANQASVVKGAFRACWATRRTDQEQECWTLATGGGLQGSHLKRGLAAGLSGCWPGSLREGKLAEGASPSSVSRSFDPSPRFSGDITPYTHRPVLQLMVFHQNHDP